MDGTTSLNKNFELVPDKPLLLFDGVCNLCSYEVQFLISHDPKGNLMFSSQQSDKGQAIIKKFNLEHLESQTVVLIDNNLVFTQSKAIVRTFKYLEGFWRYGYYLKIIPTFIPDFFYRIIAANRYRWFGKKEACWIPTKALQSRFWE